MQQNKQKYNQNPVEVRWWAEVSGKGRAKERERESEQNLDKFTKMQLKMYDQGDRNNEQQAGGGWGEETKTKV